MITQIETDLKKRLEGIDCQCCLQGEIQYLKNNIRIEAEVGGVRIEAKYELKELQVHTVGLKRNCQFGT